MRSYSLSGQCTEYNTFHTCAQHEPFSNTESDIMANNTLITYKHTNPVQSVGENGRLVKFASMLELAKDRWQPSGHWPSDPTVLLRHATVPVRSVRSVIPSAVVYLLFLFPHLVAAMARFLTGNFAL